MGFPLVQKSVILDAIMAIILCYFTKFGSFGSQLCNSGWISTCPVLDNNVAQRTTFWHYMTYGDIFTDYWETVH